MHKLEALVCLFVFKCFRLVRTDRENQGHEDTIGAFIIDWRHDHAFVFEKCIR